MTVRRRLIAVTNLVFWAAIAYASVAYVLPRWREARLSERLASLPVTYLAIATALLACQYLSIFQLWRRILRLLGASASPWAVFHAYALSLLPRYVPGKVLAQGMRLRLALVAEIPVRLVVASLAWETLLGFGSAVTIVALGLALGAAGGLEGAARWVLVCFLAIALMSAMLWRIPPIGSRLRQWLGAAELGRSLGSAVALLALYLATWLVAMLAHWVLALAIAPLPSGQLFPLLVALCVSWGAGMLSLVAPAGLGVREGVLFLFVRNWMSPADALLFVTLSRVCAFVAELVLTAAAGAISLAAPASTEVSKSSS